MIRPSKTRWLLGVALAGFVAGVLSVVTSAHAASATNDDMPIISAGAIFPDDPSFAAASIDPPLSALAVKSTTPFGSGFAHDSSWPVDSPVPSTAAGSSRVVSLPLTYADQNLRLRL